MFYSNHKRVSFKLIGNTDGGEIWHGETGKISLEPNDPQIKTNCHLDYNLQGSQLRNPNYFYSILRNHDSITIKEVLGFIVDSPISDESYLVIGVNDTRVLNENVYLDKWFYDVLGLSVEWSSL